MNPASQNGRTASTTASRSGPQGMLSATSSGRTNWLAAAKPAVVGRSAFTGHPPANHRNCSWARSTARSRSGSQHMGSCPIPRAPPLPIRGAPATPFHPATSAGSGSVATRWSASGANRATASSPPTATAISTPCSGRSHARPESTR